MAVEEPRFDLVKQEGQFAIRDYPGLIVAEVAVDGDMQSATNAGFRLLAGYIFGGNAGGRKIDMTAPVAISAESGTSIAMTKPVMTVGEGHNWLVQFTMPHEHTLETLPVPTDGRVRIRQLPPTRMAVCSFSGLSGADRVNAKTSALADWVAAQGLRSTGPGKLARYDPPWTPWFMRRNEVMLQIAA